MSWGRVVVHAKDTEDELLDVRAADGEDNEYAPNPLLVELRLRYHSSISEAHLVEAFVEAWIVDDGLGGIEEIEGVRASGWQPACWEGESCVKNVLSAHKV